MENILKPPFTKKSNELIIILVLGFIFTVAASSYNLFESIVIFIESCDSEGLGGLMLVLSVYVPSEWEFFPSVGGRNSKTPLYFTGKQNVILKKKTECTGLFLNSPAMLLLFRTEKSPGY